MVKEGKYRIVLIEPSEIVATGIQSIINRNPEFVVVQTLNSPAYYNSGNSFARKDKYYFQCQL